MINAFVLDDEQRQFVRTETIISTFMNGFVPATALWFLFADYPVSLLGPNGLAIFVTRGTLTVGFGMPIILTLVTRLRMRFGKAPATAWDRRDHPCLRYLPDNLVLRALLCALTAAIVLVPSGLAAASLIGLFPMGRVAFVLFNFIYGAALGLMLTPALICAAISDKSRGDRERA